jgi:Glycosyl transferases group 1
MVIAHLKSMKIGIFYSELFFYVSSFHPRLVSTLHNCKEIQLINVTKFTADEIIEQAAKFDLIVIDHTILMCSIKDTNPNFTKNIHLNDSSKPQAFYLKIFKKLLFLEGTKKIFWFHGDPHGLHAPLNERIEAVGEFVGAINNMCIGVIIAQSINRYLKENELDTNYTKEFAVFSNVVDNLNDLIGQNITIEIPHCVELEEKKDSFKIWELCIPGVSYTTRKIARESVLGTDVNTAPYLRLMYLFEVLSFKLLKFTNRKFKTWLGYQFIRFASSSSKITFVCGSGLRYLVRKFIEIPMYNTTMLCYPCIEMEEYGFVNDEHAVFCKPADAGIEAKKLLADPAKMKRLRANALKLVLEKHTTKARAEQLVKALQLAAQDKLINSYFKKGEYVYDTK